MENCLRNEEIKSMLGQLESLSISELKGFRKTIDAESELVYAEWFKDEGKKIETIKDEENPGSRL